MLDRDVRPKGTILHRGRKIGVLHFVNVTVRIKAIAHVVYRSRVEVSRLPRRVAPGSGQAICKPSRVVLREMMPSRIQRHALLRLDARFPRIPFSVIEAEQMSDRCVITAKVSGRIQEEFTNIGMRHLALRQSIPCATATPAGKRSWHIPPIGQRCIRINHSTSQDDQNKSTISSLSQNKQCQQINEIIDQVYRIFINLEKVLYISRIDGSSRCSRSFSCTHGGTRHKVLHTSNTPTIVDLFLRSAMPRRRNSVLQRHIRGHACRRIRIEARMRGLVGSHGVDERCHLAVDGQAVGMEALHLIARLARCVSSRDRYGV
jgi:hypothetical protein